MVCILKSEINLVTDKSDKTDLICYIDCKLILLVQNNIFKFWKALKTNNISINKKKQTSFCIKLPKIRMD